MSSIPDQVQLDQTTVTALIESDALCQRVRALFELLDWSVIPEQVSDPHQRGHRPHQESAYLKALLLKLSESLTYCTTLRRYLVEHPLLVLELGFTPVRDAQAPYGFDVERTVPSARWLRKKQQSLDPCLLSALLSATVQALLGEIPGLGETVAFDVTHIAAWVKENNLRAYVSNRYDPTHQPTGDPDCKLGVKRSTNKEQPDGSSKEVKEYYWGYGSGVATSTDPVYGDIVLAEYTQPFNENDVTFFHPLYVQTVATLGFYPTNLTADAAYDAWYIYERAVHHGGIAAIPLNQHGHPVVERDADGVPLCAAGLRMVPQFPFAHTNGYSALRFRCPLVFPQPRDFTCRQPQFASGRGCVKDVNWEKGGLMRVLLNRDSPQYTTVYRQRTSCERVNSHSKEQFGLAHPKVRNQRSVEHLTTLTYILINLKALYRARLTNRLLLRRRLS
ncbi:MAG TPA: transposase [Ktedonobacteraceae bacterium]|nr:transposase [Ktedonobacteraceae bacterium]